MSCSPVLRIMTQPCAGIYIVACLRNYTDTFFRFMRHATVGSIHRVIAVVVVVAPRTNGDCPRNSGSTCDSIQSLELVCKRFPGDLEMDHDIVVLTDETVERNSQ